MFIDKAVVEIVAGNGGDGAIAFRREACVEKGGPSGGDGGRGGSIYFVGDNNVNTLLEFKYKRKIKADDGQNGMTKKCYGRKGEDVFVKVPLGTIVYDVTNDYIIADINEINQKVLIAKGGRGGRGNCHFVSSRHQAPEIAENGEFGERITVRLELKLLADVGFVGFPSVGKSSLLSVISAAKPEIAAYHFTTLAPILGVVKVDENKNFVVADLPGLIEGASQGKGLGFNFLKHIERCRVLVHVIDMASTESRDPYNDYLTIKHELEEYNPSLLKRPQLIVANKMDQDEAHLFLEEFKAKLQDDIEIIEVSTITKTNINKLIYKLSEILDNTPRFPLFDEKDEYKVYLNTEDFCKVKYEDGFYVVYGNPVEKAFYRTNFSTDAGVLKFMRILRYNGVEEKLKEAGIKDGDSVKICDYEFDYYE